MYLGWDVLREATLRCFYYAPEQHWGSGFFPQLPLLLETAAGRLRWKSMFSTAEAEQGWGYSTPRPAWSLPLRKHVDLLGSSPLVQNARNDIYF